MRKLWVIFLLFGFFGLSGQITTSGVGEASLVPDQVHFFIGIRADHDDASRALSLADARAHAIIEGFRGLGVLEEQMQTQGLNVYPTNDYQDGRVVRSYYIAEHRLKITVNDLLLIGQGFDIATQPEGKNTVSIQLDSSQRSIAKERALADAILNARRNATIMAETENLTVGDILHMTNTFMTTPQFGYDNNRLLDSSSSTVMPGQIVISASATVIYEIPEESVEPE